MLPLSFSTPWPSFCADQYHQAPRAAATMTQGQNESFDLHWVAPLPRDFIDVAESGGQIDAGCALCV